MGKPNPQNLKPFKKGQSGNPAGRPKRRPIQDVIQEYLAEHATAKDGTAKERLMALIEAQWFKAVKNQDTKATEFLVKYGFGLPKQTIEAEIAIESVDDKRKETALRAAQRLIKE